MFSRIGQIVSFALLMGCIGPTTALAAEPAKTGPSSTQPRRETDRENTAKTKDATEGKHAGKATSRSELAPTWPSVHWRRAYRRYHAVEGVITIAAASSSVAMRLVGPTENGPQGGVWIDEDGRDLLRARTVKGRLRTQDVSDVGLGLSVSYALLFDPLINATWLRKSPDVGAQIGLINAEVLAVTLAAQQGTAAATGRERPYGRSCGTDELDSNTHKCTGKDRYRSLFSGHTSVAFSMAAATCSHHMFLALSHQPPILTCGAGFLLATATGSLRIASDNHYATDVLIGAASGTLVGFSIPLFHYWTGPRRFASSRGIPRFWVTPTWGGLQMGGAF